MSHALKNLKNSFKQKLNAKEGELHRLDIDEEILGMPVYACELITAMRKNRIFQALANDGQLAFCAEMMIQCLTDEDRKHIFQNGERAEMLTYCAAGDVELIAGQISRHVFGSDNIEEVIALETGDTAPAKDDEVTAEESIATANLKKTSKP